MSATPSAEQRARLERRGKNDAGEGDDAGERAEARDPMGIGAVREAPRGEHEARAAAERQHRGQRRGDADRKVKDLAAIGLEQDVLHAEACGAERGRDQKPACPPDVGELAPRLEEADRPRAASGQRGIARLLLPERGAVEHHRRQGRALHDLDEPDFGEVPEQQAEDDGAHRHAGEQHRAEERDDPRPGALGRKIGRERKPDRLHRVQPGADEQERERRPRPARPRSGPWCRPTG